MDWICCASREYLFLIGGLDGGFLRSLVLVVIGKRSPGGRQNHQGNQGIQEFLLLHRLCHHRSAYVVICCQSLGHSSLLFLPALPPHQHARHTIRMGIPNTPKMSTRRICSAFMVRCCDSGGVARMEMRSSSAESQLMEFMMKSRLL